MSRVLRDNRVDPLIPECGFGERCAFMHNNRQRADVAAVFDRPDGYASFRAQNIGGFDVAIVFQGPLDDRLGATLISIGFE